MEKSIESRLDRSLLEELSKKNVEKLKKELMGQVDKQEIEDHYDVIKAIDAYGTEVLRKELKLVHKKYFGSSDSKGMKSGSSRWKLALVFGVIALALAWFFNRTVNTEINSTQLYAEYYQRYDYSNSTRNVKLQSQFELGILYQDKQYQAFIDQYEQHYKQRDDLSSDLFLAVGIAYMETAQPYKAVYQFDRIIDNNDFNYSDTALWYKALALLKADELNPCKEILIQLAEDTSSNFYEDSQALLQDINKSIK